MRVANVATVILLLVVMLNFEFIAAQSSSSSMDQLKMELDEIEKRICTEPLPSDQQLEQMEECSPITKIVGKDLVKKCLLGTSVDAGSSREAVLKKYCASSVQERAEFDKKVFTCITDAAKASPTTDYKQMMEFEKAWETLDANQKKEESKKQLVEMEKRLKEAIQCEKSALNMKS